MRSIVKPGTIDTIRRLERELEESRRSADAAALREVLAAVARPGQGWLTTGQAAKRVRISIPTVRDWIRRGTLYGADQETRWLVSESSVEKGREVAEDPGRSGGGGQPDRGGDPGDPGSPEAGAARTLDPIGHRCRGREERCVGRSGVPSSILI